MATVVVVFPSTPLTSSTPVPCSLRVSSVRSGRISLIARTSVVLPTPNPPAIKILVVTGGRSRPASGSESFEPIKHFPQHVHVGYVAGLRRAQHRDKSLVVQVAQQDAHHPQREADVRGDVGDGYRRSAQTEHALLLG